MTKEIKAKGKGPAYQRWYESHKEEFNRKRREKYAADPQYRQTAKDQANASRRREPAAGPPDGYPYTFEAVAEHLGISTFSLRDWRRRGYFPLPTKQGLRLYFSAKQLNLLDTLHDFLDGGGARRPDDLEIMKNTVFMNWES